MRHQIDRSSPPYFHLLAKSTLTISQSEFPAYRQAGPIAMDRKSALLEQRVSNLEKENDILKQQNAIQEKLTELAKREAEVYRIAFEKEKELTDRALKLAEVGKPKSNWELQGLLGLAAFVVGFLASK